MGLKYGRPVSEPRLGRLLSTTRRLDQVGIAALAAGALVLIGIGFAVLSPLLAGPPKAEALPASSAQPGAAPAGGPGGTASPSAAATEADELLRLPEPALT